MENKEAYVHNEVILTCTSGFTTSKLIVKDRGVRISGGRLIATEEDKPSDFSCKWAGIIAAVIVALLITAPFLVAILASFVAGMVFSLVAGGAICWMALQGSQWTNVHKQVVIQGKKALVENSVLTCPVGGNIKMFYDKSTAQQELRNNQLKNSIEILGASFAVRSIMSAYRAYGFTDGAKYLCIQFFKGLPSGIVTSYVNDVTTDVLLNEDSTEQIVKNSLSHNSIKDKVQGAIVEDIPWKEIQVEPESKLFADKKHFEKQPSFDEYEQRKQEQYKRNNPIHRYRRGKESPHFSRQKHNQQKINRRARSFATAQRMELSNRYYNNVKNKISKNFNQANRGITAFFFVTDFIQKYQEKSFQKDMQNHTHPENVARSSVSVVAINRK